MSYPSSDTGCIFFSTCNKQSLRSGWQSLCTWIILHSTEIELYYSWATFECSRSTCNITHCMLYRSSNDSSDTISNFVTPICVGSCGGANCKAPYLLCLFNAQFMGNYLMTHELFFVAQWRAAYFTAYQESYHKCTATLTNLAC